MDSHYVVNGNWFAFIFILMAPPLIGYFLVLMLLGQQGPAGTKAAISGFKLEPSTGLLAQPAFWLSLAVPFLYALIFGGVVWCDYSLDLSERGFGIFLDISKLPFAFAALSIPLGALVARAHSTAQTAAQIIELGRKNNFELFYKHQEAFIEHLKRETKIPDWASDTEGELFNHLALLYERLFPNNSPLRGVSLDCDSKVLEHIRTLLLEAHKDLVALSKGTSLNDIANYYYELSSRVSQLISELNLGDAKLLGLERRGYFNIEISYSNGNKTGGKCEYYDFSLGQWLQQINFCHQVFGLVCKFCHVNPDLHTFLADELVSSISLMEAESENELWQEFRRAAKVNMGNYQIIRHG